MEIIPSAHGLNCDSVSFSKTSLFGSKASIKLISSSEGMWAAYGRTYSSSMVYDRETANNLTSYLVNWRTVHGIGSLLVSSRGPIESSSLGSSVLDDEPGCDTLAGGSGCGVPPTSGLLVTGCGTGIDFNFTCSMTPGQY